MTIPSKQDFATEVRVDRLRMLWRVTLVAAVLVGWILLNVSMLQRTDVPHMIIPVAIMIVGALATRSALNRSLYTAAAWAYVISGIVALAVGLVVSDPTTSTVLPFAFPILIFIVGLLLQPANTIMISVVSALIILGAPILAGQGFLSTPMTQIGAIALSLLSAVVAAQVAGDLYQIADWALSNYQRERRVSGELFESEQTLERTLARSNALGDRLQETNVELEQARATAEEAKHFRGQFLANMSHELRTPLNAIIGFSETMLKFPAMYDDVRLPNAYEADLAQIYTSGRQLLTLINDILDLAKVDAGKLEVRMTRVDLHSLCTNVMSTASGLVGGKPIHLESDLPGYLPPIWADETRVRQVLLNLYSNAAKFTESGTIKLAVREIEGGVEVSVSDTGIGISQSNADLIFEEFKQAETGGRDPRSGAGLGLSISRQLLTLMGGRIWVESELGHGSTFCFTLQAYHEQPATTVTPEPVMASEMLNVSR